MLNWTCHALGCQEAAWFDEDEHSSGAMSARLATDASAVRGAVVRPPCTLSTPVCGTWCMICCHLYVRTHAWPQVCLPLLVQGDQLGLLFQNLVTMVGGFAIAFAYGWRMTLVVLSVVPLMMAAGWAQVSLACEHS